MGRIRNLTWNSWLLLLPLAVMITAVYYRVFLDNFFSYDDFRYIENIFQGPRSVILGYNSLRILGNIVWWPLYLISGYNPVGYNIYPLVLHVVNALLVYLLANSLFARRDLAFLAGAIFAANGVGADAIFWKCANNTILSVSFYLLTLWAYAKYRESGSRKYMVGSAAAFFLAMFSKEDAASLPAIILLMECLFFNGLEDKKRTIKRIIPYCIIILFYLMANRVVFNYLLSVTPEPAKFFKIRPLHTLLAGWTVFFLNPNGKLNPSNPLIYITALSIPLSFFLVKDRRMLLFAFGWIFLTFIPQSFTTLGQFEPRIIFNSISRYLYIVSVGSSLAYAILLISVKDNISVRVHYLAAFLFMVFFITTNYKNLQSRGLQWRQEAAPVAQFLDLLKERVPNFPRKSYVYVIDPPVGRAYMQQSLRAFYKDTDITWVTEPDRFRPKNDEYAFLITTYWGRTGVEGVLVQRW